MDQPPDLTIQQTAEILRVSFQYVTKELDEGRLPFRLAGVDRVIAHRDLMEYKAKCQLDHDKAMNELVAQAQDLNMGY